ncbi:TolB family protein [Oricola cellulosilytica]|uniref:Transporter n=1 Tax=Oricola cellulosilytica TaxID=1429082 RepID=A0A4R0PCB9_9HYPH|nr:TolB family protein [Oricola cellulosilytica]TCD15112.1 hypothetical protein E0D97_06065 [Oricola cellulosilytica]
MKSIVATFDLETGTSQTVLAVDLHLEAPNWTRDGTALIVNGGGRLFSLPLASPSLQEIDTGFACRLNNDHGISPDGTMLVISDSTRTEESCIYTLPFTGGEPRRITEKVPSYWHGWSPDGRDLAYTARREKTFQIFTCPADSGSETRVTRDFDHCDGPDYTPDGEWIWFNGETDGSVQLWRIRPDGTDLERMTDDERVNWFPHPSPNGKSVVYLAYENGTRGHPANRHVELRMMPADGGTSQLLTKLFGGQGTINVPSWSPDGRRFAFVRYDVV